MEKKFVETKTAVLIGLIALVVLLSGCVTEDYVRQKIAEANYCDAKEDCVNIGSSCPFGCDILVNKSQEQPIKNLLNSYRDSSGMECVYMCTVLGPISCENNKCVMREPELNLKCQVSNCHGAVECDMLPEDYRFYCTEEALPGDVCRQLAKCEVVNGDCQVVAGQDYYKCLANYLEEECVQQGGFWNENCGLVRPCCNFKTTDFGEECTSSGECEGLCVAESVEAVSGTCSEWKTTFGCLDVFEDDGEIRAICFD